MCPILRRTRQCARHGGDRGLPRSIVAVIDPEQALAAAARMPQAASQPTRRVLVLGGGGTLGAAILEQLLASHRFERVGVVVSRPVAPALRGLVAVRDEPAAWAALAPDAALIVFDRTRQANGRDDAFVRAEPQELAARARALHAAGVRRLLVAMPHAAAFLPQALKAGLASLDEAAVAALGFDQLVFMRLARHGGEGAGGAASAPQRLAHWVLSQLHWMIPVSEQPVRAQTIARVLCEWLLAGDAGPPGTRVLPQDLLWHAAQGADVAQLVQRWLAGEPLPAMRTPRRRW
jgi:hypothetical protein